AGVRPEPGAGGRARGPGEEEEEEGNRPMESLCEYLMYFPAGPVPDYRRYRGLPRRAQLYLGETVRFVLVVRRRGQGRGPGPGPGEGDNGQARGLDPRSWRELSGSLSALASVCPGLQHRHRAPPPQRPLLPEDTGPAAPSPAPGPGPGPGPGQPEDGAGRQRQRQAEGEEPEPEPELEEEEGEGEEAGGFRECRPLLTHGGGGGGVPGKEGGSGGQ
ncbi:hypothetical protein chiPu_0030255, partial [Chiloscyllium punctatum]|nr:hypothetical protein [Chiloscyllium punctatum]